MTDLPDYEARAAEADRLAESAVSCPMAQGWRDIATGYRLLAQFVAASQSSSEGTDDRYVGFSA